MPNILRLFRLNPCLWLIVLCCQASGAAAQQQAAPPAEESPPAWSAPAVTDPMLAPVPAAARLIASFADAILLVQGHSPNYLSTQQNVLVAEARSRIARSALLPTLTGQATYTHQFFTEDAVTGGRTVEVPPQDVFGLGAQFALPVINPRALYGLDTAKTNLRAAELGVVETKRGLALQVIDAMLSTLATERVANLNREGLRAALERLALAEARLHYGQGPQLDLDLAKQDVARARADLIMADEAVHEAREALGVLLGSTLPTAADEHLDLRALERDIVNTCRMSHDIEAQPAVAAARARLEVAKRAITDAQLRLAPSFSVLSAANYQTEVMLGPRALWNLQGVLNVPFYDGGTRYGVIAESRAFAEQARQELAAARLLAITSDVRAKRSVTVYQSSRDVAREHRDLAKRIDRRLREGYAQGVGTSLDLVISAESLRQAETNLALLEFQVGKARAVAALTNAECVY